MTFLFISFRLIFVCYFLYRDSSVISGGCSCLLEETEIAVCKRRGLKVAMRWQRPGSTSVTKQPE